MMESRTPSRRNLIILALLLVIAMLGYGMVMPIFPFYIEQMGASGSDLGVLMAVAAFTEMVFGPLWGSLSDRTGRKPILVVGLLGSSISLVWMGLADTFNMLLAARAVSGLLTAALASPALAYISDSTTEKGRSGSIGIMVAVMEAGIIIGPGLGGLLGRISLSTPFFAAAGLCVAAVGLVLVFLPESIRKEEHTAVEHGEPERKKALSFGDLRAAVFSPLGLLLFLIAFAAFALSNFEAVFGLYALQKFSYGTDRVGAILMVVGIVSVIGKGLLTGPTTNRWGDAAVVKASLAAGVLGYLALLAANTYPTVLLSTGFFTISKTLLRPSLFSLVSKSPHIRQGKAMGLCNSFTSLGRIGGTLLAGALFDWKMEYPYLSGAFLLLIGFLISLAFLHQPQTE